MSESVRAADFKIVRLEVRGELYTPIVGPSGTYLSPSELAMLTQVSGLEPTPLRRVQFVLCDESTPRPGHAVQPLGLAHFRAREPLPLELGDSECAVGVVDAIWAAAPGATPGTAGRHVLATARLDDSILADVVWRGIRDGVLSGVCAVCLGEPDDNEFIAVRLGPLEESGLPGARILEHWEEPAPGAIRSLIPCQQPIPSHKFPQKPHVRATAPP